MPTILCPLLAAGLDWLEALLPFLFVAFWIISQVFAVFRRIQGGDAKRPLPPRPVPPRPAVRPPAEGEADWRGDLERQIEEFLKQSRGEQVRRAEGPAAGPRKADQPPRSQPRPQPAVKPAGERKPAATREPRRPQPSAATPAAAATPPSSAEAPVESVARHVQDAFAHDLAHGRGGLAQDASVPQAQASRSNRLAVEIAEMLRSPAATRRAILLREVLDRPVDRW